MRVKTLKSKISPQFKVADSLNLNQENLLDLRTLNTNIIVDMLEHNIKKRQLPLLKKLKQ